jgi:hypothetical protein
MKSASGVVEEVEGKGGSDNASLNDPRKLQSESMADEGALDAARPSESREVMPSFSKRLLCERELKEVVRANSERLRGLEDAANSSVPRSGSSPNVVIVT